MNATVRPLEPADWPAVQRIYAEGIATGSATFETEPPSTWAVFDDARLPGHRLVALAEGSVAGWVAVSAVSSRPVYRGVVEHSVYVAAGRRGQRLGHLLLGALVDSTEASGIWTIQSSIFPENTASLALHARHGFRTVGTRERVGRDHTGRWRDTVLIERRSRRI